MTVLHSVPNPVADLLDATRLGARQAHKALALWPLLLRDDAPPPAGPPYVTLGAALVRGSVRVDEVSEGGSVPHVRVTNKGDVAVLFLFGEEIRGAKQNRIANASFLVDPGTQVVLDVSCVEQGRWQRRDGDAFERAVDLVSHDLRRDMTRYVAQSRARTGRFAADQGAVWDEVHRRLELSATRSPTAAYADYRAARAVDLDEIGRAFRPLGRQVGFVALQGDEVVGVEAIGRPEVFAAAFDALLRAYAIDAVDAALLREPAPPRPSAAPAPRFEDPEPFLEALAGAPFEARPSLGAGDDLRIAGAGVEGCALVRPDVVHLTAFPARG